MKFLGEDVVRHLGRVLQFAPVAIAFFFALSFWRKGFTEGAIITGLIGIGLLLLIVLLHVIEKITGNTRRFVLVCSILIIAIGVHSLVIGNIYDGIFYVLLGMTFLFMAVLKGKWGIICSTVVLVLAIGFLILYFLEAS